MIMAEEQALLKAQKLFDALKESISQANQSEQRIDQVERDVMTQLLQIGLVLVKAFVASQGDGDVGPTRTTADGRQLRRLPEAHERRYVSIFGELLLHRFVYGTREGQKIEAAPLDERLGLPAGEFSYVLADWAQRLCLKESFAEAGEGLKSLLGLRLSVRSLEHMNRALAEAAEPFRDQQPPPPAAEEGELLVVTADGKGVPMRRPAPAEKTHARRKKGEKANKKQMAYVGAVYSIAPFVRTADDVVDELWRRTRAKERPPPQHKRVWVEMTHPRGQHTRNGQETLFANLSDELVRRNRGVYRKVICLLDGERGLWEQHKERIPWAIGILDLFHALEKLWLAGHALHGEGSLAAEDFVTERLRLLLQGKVDSVIRGLGARARQRTGGARRTLHNVVRYLKNNREHMRYDEYLAAGYPIGSGVAEGACRHVVKDRMEQSGMRWTVAGAQSMLHLRALYLNGDWEQFHNYWIHREQQHLYQTAA